MYFRLMAAIFDLPLPPMSNSVHTSPTELLDPEVFHTCFLFMAAILISGSDTVINYISSISSNLDDLYRSVKTV